MLRSLARLALYNLNSTSLPHLSSISYFSFPLWLWPPYISRTLQTCSCLRAFLLADFSAWNPLHISAWLTVFLLEYDYQWSLPWPLFKTIISRSPHSLLSSLWYAAMPALTHLRQFPFWTLEGHPAERGGGSLEPTPGTSARWHMLTLSRWP